MQTQTRLLALRRPQLRLYLSHNQNFRSEFRLICWKFLYRRLRKVFLLRCWKYRRRVRRINFKRIRKITTHRAILIKKKLNFFYAIIVEILSGTAIADLDETKQQNQAREWSYIKKTFIDLFIIKAAKVIM